MHEKCAKREVGRLTTSEKIDLWNEYQRNGNYEGEIFINDDEFVETYCPDALEYRERVKFGDYRQTDKYVCFDGYANLVSFNTIEDANCPYNEDELVDALVRGYVQL